MPVPGVSRNEAVHFNHGIRDDSGNVPGRSDPPIGGIHGASSDILPGVEAIPEGDRARVKLGPAEGLGESGPAPTVTGIRDASPEEIVQGVPADGARFTH